MNVMRSANLLLYASGFILCIVSIGHYNYYGDFWWTLAFYAFEAAFVGSVADWFAVTALFKKPWGLNIHHTELIHRDREALIASISNTIQNEMIKMDSIKGYLRNFDFTAMIINFLNNPQQRATTISYICSLMVESGKQLDLESFAQGMSNEIKKNIQGESVASLVGNLVEKAFDDGTVKQLVNSVLEELIKYPHLKTEIYKFLDQKLGKIYKAMGDVEDITDCLITLLGELRREDSCVRQLLDEQFKRIVENLNDNPQWSASVEQWKTDVLTKVEFGPFINNCLVQAREAVIISLKDEKVEDTIVGQWIEERIVIFGENLIQDQDRRDIYNKHIRVAIISFINEERSLIGRVVTKALSSKSKEDLNKFVMGIAGEDLAWIRRNGTLVGMMVGVIIYLIGFFIIDPYIGPHVRFLFGVE